MNNAQKRYLDADAYKRGVTRHEKHRSRWYTTQFIGGISAAVSSAFFGLIYTPQFFPGNSLAIILLAATIVFLLGIITAATAHWSIDHHKFDNFAYWIAVHCMNEMGIHHPKKLIDSNPRYLQAFEEVRQAVTHVEAELEGVSPRSKGISPNSRRIASLVLRDERSLELSPQLINTIKQQRLMDYDELAALVDNRR